MQRHEYHAGDISDTMMQGILGSLIQERCKASNLLCLFHSTALYSHAQTGSEVQFPGKIKKDKRGQILQHLSFEEIGHSLQVEPS